MARKTIEHYEIVRRLGAGGSGVVYLANDTLLQRPVVLKILRTGLLSAEQMRKTVLREARLASAIEHPNVCAIYEVGESGDEAYIVMQYVPGQSLDRLIARGPASMQLVLSVGIQIADGLQAAHSLGIFHRDLKPQNVMLTDGGLAKILDFGLARRIRPDEANFDPAKPALAKDASVAATYTARGGTIRYMAPEQFVTGQSSVQSDVWALGVILFELTTGRHPFARPDAEDFQAIRAIQFSEPPNLTEIIPGISPELQSVVLCCLEKNPAARYASAGEVREALKTIMKALQIETGSIPGEAAANLPTTGIEAEKRTTGFLSMLAERFRESAGDKTQPTSLLVLPFANLGATEVSPSLRLCAGRRDRGPPRPHSGPRRPAFQYPHEHVHLAQMDPPPGWPAPARLLRPRRQLPPFRSRLRSQLAACSMSRRKASAPAAPSASHRSISLPSSRKSPTRSSPRSTASAPPIAWMHHRPTAALRLPRNASLPGPVSEEYLQARALLSSFMVRTGSRADLDRAHALFTSVTTKDPEFAAWLERPRYRRTPIHPSRLRRPEPHHARTPRIRRSSQS